jgi:hypothetical protein
VPNTKKNPSGSMMSKKLGDAQQELNAYDKYTKENRAAD